MLIPPTLTWNDFFPPNVLIPDFGHYPPRELFLLEAYPSSIETPRLARSLLHSRKILVLYISVRNLASSFPFFLKPFNYIWRSAMRASSTLILHTWRLKSPRYLRTDTHFCVLNNSTRILPINSDFCFPHVAIRHPVVDVDRRLPVIFWVLFLHYICNSFLVDRS